MADVLGSARKHRVDSCGPVMSALGGPGARGAPSCAAPAVANGHTHAEGAGEQAAGSWDGRCIALAPRLLAPLLHDRCPADGLQW